MKKDVVLGIDIGTSSLKYTVIDANSGRVIKNIRVDYEGVEISPGVVQVSIYEKAIVQTISRLYCEYNLLSVGFSFQMYSMCEETSKGIVVYQWNSLWQRDEKIEEQLKMYMKKSGCPVDTIYPSYKLYTASKKGRTFIPYGLKEHIIKFLTGNLITDYSCASASGLLDIFNKDWNRVLLEDMGYTIEDMPVIKKYNTIAGYLRLPGIIPNNINIPVVTGLGDGMSASYACKDVSRICANVGTSMAARAFVKSEDLNYSDKTWAYVIDENTYIVGGISSNGCSVLNWSENLNLYDDISTISDNGSVMFFPWLHGERTPYWSSDLRGTFTGIDISTDKRTLYAAVVKGVGFTMVNLINLVSRDAGSSEMIIVAGGGVHKKELMEVLSGSISMEIGILHESDYLASYGAAFAAAEALGIDVDKSIDVKNVLYPNHRYEEEYEKWNQMGNKLIGLYE